MSGRSAPLKGDTTIPVANIQGFDVCESPSVNAVWAGGAVASTEKNLLGFAKALQRGSLVSV